MSSFCGTHRLPRATIDPIDSPGAALALVDLALHHPLVTETVVLVLDEDHRGRTIIVVDGTNDPDSVLDVVERIAESVVTTGRSGGLVVATARPGGGAEPGDEDRWLEASDVADDLGTELVEWFVIGGDTPTVAANATCPRDQLGELPRWRSW